MYIPHRDFERKFLCFYSHLLLRDALKPVVFGSAGPEAWGGR